jgi:hypothetical protein
LKDVGIHKPEPLVVTAPAALIQKEQQPPSINALEIAGGVALAALPIIALAGVAAPLAAPLLAAEAAEALAAEEVIPMLVEREGPIAAFDNTDFDFFGPDDI